MPDLSNCKFIKGKLYCWDATARKLFLVELTELRIVSVLDDVVNAFLDDLPKKTKE